MTSTRKNQIVATSVLGAALLLMVALSAMAHRAASEFAESAASTCSAQEIMSAEVCVLELTR